MINKVQHAWALATHYHEGQRYNSPKDGATLPYLTHLGAVMLEAQEVVRRRPDLNAELILCCAILHDSLEDTDLSPQKLRNEFSPEIALGVQALTKNETLPTKREQMEDSLRRIKEQPPEIAVVKLCDRICNLGPPPHYWDEAKIAAYREEAELILREIGTADAGLAKRLLAKITAYPS